MMLENEEQYRKMTSDSVVTSEESKKENVNDTIGDRLNDTNDLISTIARNLATMQELPNVLDPELHNDSFQLVVDPKKRRIIPIGEQVLCIQNQIQLGRRIFYLEFRTKLLNTIAELGISMNYAIQLINCLDRYIPDVCLCCEQHVREWIIQIRQTPYEKQDV